MPSLNIVEKTLKHKSDYEDSRPLAIKELLAQRADLVKPIDEKLKLLGYQEDSKPAKKDKKGKKIICKNCGEEGHNIRTCKKPKPALPPLG